MENRTYSYKTETKPVKEHCTQDMHKIMLAFENTKQFFEEKLTLAEDLPIEI